MRSFTPNQFPFVIFSALSPSNSMQKDRKFGIFVFQMAQIKERQEEGEKEKKRE